MYKGDTNADLDKQNETPILYTTFHQAIYYIKMKRKRSWWNRAEVMVLDIVVGKSKC